MISTCTFCPFYQQCERTVSLTRFIKRINDPCRKFIAVIGSGCSVATEPVAELSHFWGLSQVCIVTVA